MKMLSMMPWRYRETPKNVKYVLEIDEGKHYFLVKPINFFII